MEKQPSPKNVDLAHFSIVMMDLDHFSWTWTIFSFVNGLGCFFVQLNNGPSPNNEPCTAGTGTYLSLREFKF